MDVEALVEAPFVKNGENGHLESPRERLASSTRSHHRSPTPSSEYSRHSSSRHKKDYDRHRDGDRDYHRDDSRYRKDGERGDSHHRSGSRSRRRDDRYYDDRERTHSRDRDDHYRDDRSDRRRSRNEYDDYDERNSKRRREYDDRERSRPVDDRDYREKPAHDEPTKFARDPSPQLTEEERDLRTVFVQQLAGRLRTKELIKFFEKAGPVREAQIVKDRISGRSKGVGYVEFRNPGSVSEAISMTGQRLLGIPIIVQITEAEKNRQARLDAAAAGAGPAKEAPIHRLYIGNIHFNLTEDDIKAVFAPFGEIEQVQLQKEHDTGRSRGYGFVQFRDPPSAREALDKLNGFELAGRAIRVGLGNDKFTNESTQAILDRYDGFRGSGFETVPRGDTERIGGGGGGGRGSGGGRMSGNLDDTDIAGVSFQNVSREALMRKLARDEPKEEPVPPKPRAVITAPDVSRCVLLKNCFNPAEESGNAWVKELEDDVKFECEQKYGKVNHIHVEEDSDGEIYIKFDSVSAGENAVQGLNGRWFGGRTISASPIADAVYATKFPRVRAL